MSLMFCKHCGNALAEGAQFCGACGKAQTDPIAPSAFGVQLNSAAPPGNGPTSGMAIGSLICGLFFFAFPISIIAVILGHLALSEIKRSAGRIQGHGMAIAGLVLGYAGIAFIPIILIIAAIAIPNLLRARMAANEASAISSIRILNTAEISYQSGHTASGFTCSLSDLHRAGLIDATLASGRRTGYVFALENCTAETPGGPIVKYNVVAHPQTYNQTGIRAFCSDESAKIRVNAAGSPQDCLARGEDLSGVRTLYDGPETKELAAVAAVRSVNVAELTYVNYHKDVGFTCSLSDLNGDSFIDDELSTGRKGGYIFALSDCSAASPGGPNVKYKVVAYPEQHKPDTIRAFCSDESDIIRFDPAGSPRSCVTKGKGFQ